MAKNKSKKKNKQQNCDPKGSEDSEQTEQKEKEESLQLRQQECGSEETGSEKKKLKKEIQLKEPSIDYEVNKNNKYENYEESHHKNADKDVNEVEESKTKKKKKSNERKNISESDEQNGSEDKGIKVFNFGPNLSANISARNGQKGLSLKRKTIESIETIIEMTAEEWVALKQVMPQIDDLILKDI